MIYDGTSAHVNDETNEDRVIGKSTFNDDGWDNAYVGYMYGNLGASSYEETHTNINDSTIKSIVDNWYEDNIKKFNYEQYLSDNIFCGNRTLSNYEILNFSNKGYNQEKTAYKWYYAPWESENVNSIYLLCENKNDAYSVKDVIYGNASLKYPIALISSEEAVVAGGWEETNHSYYLYPGNNIAYWTLTPRGFTGDRATGWAVAETGQPFIWDGLWNPQSVKPVINLKPNSLKSGDGTINNPYVVE